MLGSGLPMPVELRLARLPQDPTELRLWVEAVWGVRIPDVQVCPNHSTPWRAFCDAFFAVSPVSVWKASRGLGGKSFLLATLSLTELVLLGASVNVLGGSAAQSENVLRHSLRHWGQSLAPLALLTSELGHREQRLSTGGIWRALTASQTSVRGPHPSRLRVDECDEVDIPILDAALGQPMTERGVAAQTVLSSTHQYADGTMTEVLKRAATNAWTVHEWCWRESVEPHGWLAQAEVERKRQELPAAMWLAEIDLQEPSPEGRAFLTERIDACFQGQAIATQPGHWWFAEAPFPGARYAHGCDWAKMQDWTVGVILRYDVKPTRVVGLLRMQREPWPHMVAKWEEGLRKYPGTARHDATGVGNVVGDLLRESASGVVMVGRDRMDLFADCIGTLERGEVHGPRIEPLYSEVRFCRRDDLFKTGGTNHPPDSVVALALAVRAWREAVIGQVWAMNLAEEPVPEGGSWRKEWR